LMGHGIAQVSAEKGFEVLAVESQEKFLNGGMKRITDSVNKIAKKAVAKGKATEEEAAAKAASTLGRITTSLDLDTLASCDVVIEAVVEDLNLKRPLYAKLGEIMPETAIIASNTSSLPIGAMADFCGRPKQMVGLHFFNPVQLMALVEVIRTDHTDPALFAKAMSFGAALGKTPVECIDTPGFVVNRLLVPFMVEAVLLVERGVASVPDVDVAMKLGAAHPMGPLQLADYVGLDTVLSIITGWQESHPSDGFVVPETLRQKVAEGKLGRKSGEGFYRWEGDKIAP